MADLTPMFSSSRMAELRQAFDKHAKGNSLRGEDFGKVMKECGEEVPAFKLRDIEEEVQKEKRGMLSFDDFTKLFARLSTKAVGGAYKKAVDSRKGVQAVGGTSASSAEGTRHSFSDDEQIGFSNWINSVLEDDRDLKG